MNLKSILAVIAAVLAGTIGGAAAYSVATPSSASGPTPTSTSLQPAAETQDVAAQVQKVVKLRPCKKPAERVGKKCVTDVTRTVVVPGQARSGSVAPASGTSTSGSSTPGDDDPYEDEGSTPGTGSDDQGDDDQYDDQYDDEGDDSGDDEADDQADEQDEPGDDDSSETESPEVED
jgi:hypothetical protein